MNEKKTTELQFPDTHAHLDDRRFRGELDLILSRAAERGVYPIVTIGTNMDSSRAAVKLAQSYNTIYAAVGVHPHDASGFDRACAAGLSVMADNDKVVAIGETGLDYYRDLSPRAVQRDTFRAQLEVASNIDLPVVVHDRDAHDDVMSILEQELDKNHTVIMHCFSGDKELAEQCVERQYYISFAGPITYTNNLRSQQVVAAVPVDQLLCETDCPYLTPHPFRGKRNEPGYVVEVASVLAGVHGLSLHEMSRYLTDNTTRAFNLVKGEQ